MSDIRLSILIPSVPSRLKTTLPLLVHKLEKQIENRTQQLDVELLVFTDNKRRTVGGKRNDLIRLAHGTYISFVDDDDDVSDDYVDQILKATESDADVIVFDQAVYLNGNRAGDVRFGLEYENQEVSYPGTTATRKPFQCCAWKLCIAICGLFTEKNDGAEDWPWVQQVVAIAKTQHRINKILHTYRWSKSITEATPNTWDT